jgi:DNA helicase HerA-like ATPase
MITEFHNLNAPVENLAIGTIIEVDGSHIVAELHQGITELSRVFGGDTYPVGQFGSIVKIHFGRKIIFAFVGRLRMKAEYELDRGIAAQAANDERVIEADLFGEGEWLRDETVTPVGWELKFDRGVTTYPLPQQTVYLTPKRELRFIYGHGKGPSVNLGEHVGTGGAKCFAEMNELLGKHTAILGSTGAGKSGTVAAVLHSLLERGAEAGLQKWMPRIVVLDPHNEYANAFGDKHTRLSTDEGTLKLPYWLLSFQETVSLIIGKTEFVATSQSNIVKLALLNARCDGAKALGIDPNKQPLTVDSPIPYLLQRFREEVNAQRPSGKDKKEQEPFNSIINKLETLERDSRMSFMLSPWDGKTDEFASVLSQLIGDGPPVRIVDLSGVPNEVAGICSAVIARTLFNLKVWQTGEERERDPVLLVCEEAHRYVPNRGDAQYEAAQEAIRRIAKEGRKYGIGLLLVSQRPSEVEATVLSQCSSWIILRISNDADRDHVRALLPDSVSGLTKILSGLRRQEAIFVGQAAIFPSRILIRTLNPEQLPRSNDIDFDKGWQGESITGDELGTIANRWRFQRREGCV